MELILGEERQPTDSIALVLAEFDADGDRDLVLLDFGSVEELGEELALVLTLGEEVVGEPWGVGKAGLRKGKRQVLFLEGREVQAHFERNELDQCGEGVGGDEPNVVVGIAHATKDRNDEENDVGENLDIQAFDEIYKSKRQSFTLSSARRKRTRDELHGSPPVVGVNGIANDRKDRLDNVPKTFDRDDVAQSGEGARDGVPDDGVPTPCRQRQRREQRREPPMKAFAKLLSPRGKDGEAVEQVLTAALVLAENLVGEIHVACRKAMSA